MASEERALDDDGRMSSDEGYAVRAGQDRG